jgi:hypothetical protein
MKPKGGARPKAGRKAVKIDLEQVEKLSGLQCTDAEIAAFCNVSVRTITRRRKQPAFAEAMDRGKARGLVSLRRNLWGLAARGNPAANIFLAKNLLGYKDFFSNEHTGPNGGPIAIDSRADLSKYTDEDLEQLERLINKAKPPDGD